MHVNDDPRHLISAKKACKEIGLILSTIPASSEDRSHPYPRYFFRFPYYKRDDQRAHHIAEIILHTAWIACGPLGAPNDTAPIVRIPRMLIERGQTIRLNDLAKLEMSREWSERTLYFPYETIGSYTTFSTDRVEWVWNNVPAMVKNEHLARAVRFLKNSIENFHVYPGEIQEVIDNPSVTAASPSEQTHMETALHAGFMAIEAIIGDPPKDSSKLAVKLRSIGLDPTESVGYSSKKPLQQVIREFNNARDKKSAHGSTRDRAITVLELLELQSCAELIVNAALQQKTPS